MQYVKITKFCQNCKILSILSASEDPTLNQICVSDMCIFIELARVCHTIASTQLSYGNVEVHNHILHVTLASMKDQWGRIKDRIHAPNRSASSSHDAAPG